MRRFLFVMSIALVFMLLYSNTATAYEKEIERLSSILTESIAKGGKKTVAVVDFTDLQGNVTELGRFLAEEFSAALAGAGRGFEVIDRTHLKVILKEQKLSVTDIIDPATARKLGKIAGVDALITGTITPFGERVRMTVKILDTATAKVIGASRGNIARTKGIEELLARGIDSATSTSPGGTVTNRRSQPKAVSRKVVMNNFSFEFRECKRSGEDVKCAITVINKGESDRKLTIYTNISENISGLLDGIGNQNRAKNIKFGTNTHWFVTQLLSPHLPVLAWIYFEDVSSNVHVVSLRLTVSVKKKKFFPLFRDIPLSK